MQINISARHGHLSTQTQSLITDKVEKVKRFLDRITSIVVTCDLEHQQAPRVEIHVVAEHAGEFIASDKADSLLTALDSAVHKMEQQLRKYKEKLTEKRGPGLRDLPAVEEETE